MSYFNYQTDELFCDDVKITDVAKEIPTPFFLYSATGFIQNFKML